MTHTEYRNIRKKLGLTQSGLAAMLGESREIVSMRERHKAPITESAAWAVRGVLGRKDEGLHSAVMDFLEFCENLCKQRQDRKPSYCTAYTDRGNRCPDCPREWSEELEARIEEKQETNP